MTYNRKNQNLHVAGYCEEGTITTPFDMRVKNHIDRFHLMLKVLEYVEVPVKQKNAIVKTMNEQLLKHEEYIKENGIDMPEILNWNWNDK